MNNAAEPKTFSRPWTADEAAAALGTTPANLLAAANDGRLPASAVFRIGTSNLVFNPYVLLEIAKDACLVDAIRHTDAAGPDAAG